MSQETLELESVRVEVRGPLAVVTLNDPDRLNAISTSMVVGLSNALLEVSKPRRGIRAVLLTGAGRGFCAGANLSGRSQDAGAARNLPALSGLETLYHPLIRRLKNVSVPMVAAVNGPCVGIGVSLALLCDYVIASESAYFLVPFRNLASCTDSGLTWLLPRVVGLARARQMIMRAERVQSAQALEWGLVNEVQPEAAFAKQAMVIGEEFANGPTVALGLMRQLVFESGMTMFDQHLELEARGVGVTSRTRDNSAALRLFGSKEQPRFEGA
jgi:2-(1,2-epoxy-1,2-dihydrophenyl)acetyl-CoA isomerase